MDFLWNNPIVGGIVATTGGLLILSLIPMITKMLFNMAKNKAVAKAESLLKDSPEWRKIANDIILQVQKDMSTEKGKVKMQVAIRKMQKMIPGTWDDVIIEKIVQTVYDEAKTAKIIVK